MNQRIPEQLDKILALADSSHDGEAVVAVRKARQMLNRDGLSFGDLARAAAARHAKSSGLLSRLSKQPDHLETQIHHLRQQLEDLRAQMQTQDLQVGFWRRRALDLEQNALRAQGESEKWKKLASETADHLWDMGKSIGDEELAFGKPE
ncbi:MAG: hypothetical protein WCD70_02660 [Alphaproteobacteria bacterium]